MLNLPRLLLLAAPFIGRCYANPDARSITIGPSASTSIAAASSSIAAAATSTAYPLPIPCTGEGCTEFSVSWMDHNVFQHPNGTFYRVAKDNGTGTGLSLASAPAMSGPWVLLQSILEPSTGVLVDTPGTPGMRLWTPELHYANGTFYLFYALFAPGNKGNGMSVRVATSPSMDPGSWTDHGNVSIGSHAAMTGTIDASILADYDTAPYGIDAAMSIVWGSFGAGLYGMQLDSGDPTTVMQGTEKFLIQDQLYPVANPHPGNNRTGGSFHSRMNGYVYYFYDIGSCCARHLEASYTVFVCRAENASGPYYDNTGKACGGNPDGTLSGAGTKILQTHTQNAKGVFQVFSPGAVGIVSLPEGPVLTYQYHNHSQDYNGIPEGATVGYNYLNFDSDGWPFLSETAQKLSSANGTLPSGSVTAPVSSSPTASSLGSTATPNGVSVFKVEKLSIVAWMMLSVALMV